MSKKPVETPSSVLKETLLEYSRQQRHRHRHHHHHRHLQYTGHGETRDEVQDFNPVEQAMVDIVANALQEEGEGPPGSEEASAVASDESFKMRGENGEENIITAAEDEDLNKMENQGPSHPLYRHKDETSIDSVMIEEIRSKTCTCACACCSSSDRFFIPTELRDGDKPVQTRFIQKVFAVLLLKSALILTWLTVVESCSSVRKIFEKGFYYHFFGLGAYLLIKIIVRLTKDCRNCGCFVLLLIFLLEITAVADFIGFLVSQIIGCYVVPRKVLYAFVGVCIFFIFVGYFMTFDMVDGIMVAAALIVCFMVGLEQALHLETGPTFTDVHSSKLINQAMRGFSILIVSELITTITIVELKSVLTGRRFSPKKTDWFFTSLYVI